MPVVSSEWAGGSRRAAGTAPGAAVGGSIADGVVRSPELLTAEGGGN